jgi:hypothetical protein
LDKPSKTIKPLVGGWVEWQQRTYSDDMDSYQPITGTDYTFRTNVVAIEDFKTTTNKF